MAVRHFYVDSNVAGSNTGTTDTSYALRQTGAMSSLTASNVYDRLGRVLIISSPPVDGDFIYLADNHSASYDNITSPSINAGGAYGGAGVQIISVDTTAIAEYKPGSSDTLTDVGDDFKMYKNSMIRGASLGTGDDIFTPLIASTHVLVVDSTLSVAGDSDILYRASGYDGSTLQFVNVDVNTGHAGCHLALIANASRFVWRGGALTGTAIADFCDANCGINGGAFIECVGVDLSNVSGTLMPATTAGTTDEFIFRISNCKLNDSLTNLHGTLADQQHRFEMFNCDDSSDKFYRFYIADGTGSAKNNDSVYVTAGDAWYGGADHSSIQVDTTALCSFVKPFIFELPAQYVDLAVSTTDVLTIEMVTLETLKQHDMAAFLVYPDGATAVNPNWVSSGPSATGYYGIDPLDDTTVMPTGELDATDWEEPVGTEIYYKMVLDTSVDVGQATAVGVRIEVYKDLTNPVYIHPLITVSAT